jgi:predicted Zn-dependent protease with MMP-like domain
MQLSDQEFDEVVQKAIEELPEEFRDALEHVMIDIIDLPDREMARDANADRYGLLGLYRGVPLTEQSVEQVVQMPARIILFKKNIERMCETREAVIEQIRVTLLHEIGHHFGYDEEELDDLGYG